MATPTTKTAFAGTSHICTQCGPQFEVPRISELQMVSPIVSTVSSNLEKSQINHMLAGYLLERSQSLATGWAILAAFAWLSVRLAALLLPEEAARLVISAWPFFAVLAVVCWYGSLRQAGKAATAVGRPSYRYQLGWLIGWLVGSVGFGFIGFLVAVLIDDLGGWPILVVAVQPLFATAGGVAGVILFFRIAEKRLTSSQESVVG